ncbi:MAG: YbhN family protein [Cyanobacteria bacterium P01_H01_bin.58]
MPMQYFIRRLKPYLRWVILAVTLGFLLHSLRQNWQQVLALRLTVAAIANLLIALGITLLAHIWSGWVWHWIIRLLNIQVAGSWSVITYLKTNIGKYLPGNVWHFLGRIQALRSQGAPVGIAATAVGMEPLLMAAAALALIVVSRPTAILQAGILLVVLVGVHPRVLNPLLKRLTAAKLKQSNLVAQQTDLGLRHYPLKPLIGEVTFVLIRGAGFLFILAALTPTTSREWPFVIGNFSIAWLLGLVVPGAPGGLGIFESTALALLGPTFTPAAVLGAVTLYRLVSTLAELLGAALAVLDERWNTAVSTLQISSQGSDDSTVEEGVSRQTAHN